MAYSTYNNDVNVYTAEDLRAARREQQDVLRRWSDWGQQQTARVPVTYDPSSGTWTFDTKPTLPNNFKEIEKII